MSGWSNDDSTASKGVFTGLTAVHPLTHQPLPVWVADYVISDYGKLLALCVYAVPLSLVQALEL